MDENEMRAEPVETRPEPGSRGGSGTSSEWLADRFEEQRPHLRSVAYRMLGSLSEADDAVQDTWLRVSRAGVSGGREPRRLAHHDRCPRVSEQAASSECPTGGGRWMATFPIPWSVPIQRCNPREEALLADSVSLALLVVLDTLASRAACVRPPRHVPAAFEEIAPMVGRSPQAARQLASRARRRVKGAEIPAPDPDLARQREWSTPSSRQHEVVTSTRWSQCSILRSYFDPTMAPDDPPPQRCSTAQRRVANQALIGALPGAELHPALINGTAGVVITVHGRPVRRHGVHCRARQDRRDRCHRRSGTCRSDRGVRTQ